MVKFSNVNTTTSSFLLYLGNKTSQGKVTAPQITNPPWQLCPKSATAPLASFILGSSMFSVRPELQPSPLPHQTDKQARPRRWSPEAAGVGGVERAAAPFCLRNEEQRATQNAPDT